MTLGLVCQGCGLQKFDYDDFAAMILLDDDRALMQFKCPTCGVQLGLITQVPGHILEQIKPQVQRSIPAKPKLPQRLLDEAAISDEDEAMAPFYTSIVCYSSSLG
jgi:hypothetical protein